MTYYFVSVSTQITSLSATEAIERFEAGILSPVEGVRAAAAQEKAMGGFEMPLVESTSLA
jgi:hypothetical protein